MLAANPEWIQDTLTVLREKYGGARDYYQDVSGLSSEKIDRILENFLS